MNHKPIAPERLPALLRAMPKAELHMHIEGSLEPELIFAMGQRNGVALNYPSVEALRSAYVFNNLQEFLDIYHAGTTVLKTEQDFCDMANAYLARAQADNVVHAEIFFDTQTHTGHGTSVETVINGLHSACQEAPLRHGMTASLILCFLRHLSEAEAFECLEQVLPHRDKIVGIGLASSEVGHPPEGICGRLSRRLPIGAEVVVLAAYGWVWGFVYGAIMNIWFWPYLAGQGALAWEPGLGLAGTVERYWSFYTVTSLAWDAAAALTNGVLILVTGRVALRTFRRFESRLVPGVVLEEDAGSERGRAAAHDAHPAADTDHGDGPEHDEGRLERQPAGLGGTDIGRPPEG